MLSRGLIGGNLGGVQSFLECAAPAVLFSPSTVAEVAERGSDSESERQSKSFARRSPPAASCLADADFRLPACWSPVKRRKRTKCSVYYPT